MKSILFTFICGIFTFSVFAQEREEKRMPKRTPVIADRDTIMLDVDNKKKEIEIIFEMGEESIDHNMRRDTTLKVRETKKHLSTSKRRQGTFGGVTFSNFDLGLAKMLDNGKKSLSAENDFLSYRSWKSVNVGFDLLQIGYRYNDQYLVTLSAGLDWTHFRLRNDVIIEEDTSPLTFENSAIHYSKNRFSSSYLRIPLTFEYRTKAGALPRRLRYSFGPIAGILIQGSQKFKSSEEGKTKTIDNFNYAPFRYGAFLRVRFGAFGLYGKYYFNDMFQNSPDQEGLKNLSYGLMFLF